MSPKSILLIVALMMLIGAAGCHCPTANTPARETKIEPTLGVTIQEESPLTPYVDGLLATLNKPTRAPAATFEDTTTTEAVPTPPARPQSRTRPHRERRVVTQPIQPAESPALVDLTAPPVPEPVVTLKIVIVPPQGVVTAPVASNREVPTTAAPIMTVASSPAPAWPRQLGTFRRQCGHLGILWLLSPDRAVISSEPSCGCGSSNVEIGVQPHANARIVNFSGEPGWVLTYCQCGRYCLARQ